MKSLDLTRLSELDFDLLVQNAKHIPVFDGMGISQIRTVIAQLAGRKNYDSIKRHLAKDTAPAPREEPVRFREIFPLEPIRQIYPTSDEVMEVLLPENGLWLYSDTITIAILNFDDGIKVDLLVRDQEFSNALATAEAKYADAIQRRDSSTYVVSLSEQGPRQPEHDTRAVFRAARGLPARDLIQLAVDNYRFSASGVTHVQIKSIAEWEETEEMQSEREKDPLYALGFDSIRNFQVETNEIPLFTTQRGSHSHQALRSLCRTSDVIQSSGNWAMINGEFLDPCFDIEYASPTGFSVGYSGSGPSQLALAIFVYLFGEDYSKHPVSYRDFLHDYIARMEQTEEWSIPIKDIASWIIGFRNKS